MVDAKKDTRPLSYKTFFMVNSIEHEIFPVKMYGILMFMSRKNSILGLSEP